MPKHIEGRGGCSTCPASKPPQHQGHCCSCLQCLCPKRWGQHNGTQGARDFVFDLVHVRSFADAAEPKMQALSERTGAHIVMFMTRGHVDDQVTPAWFASSGAAHF